MPPVSPPQGAPVYRGSPTQFSTNSFVFGHHDVKPGGSRVPGSDEPGQIRPHQEGKPYSSGSISVFRPPPPPLEWVISLSYSKHGTAVYLITPPRYRIALSHSKRPWSVSPFRYHVLAPLSLQISCPAPLPPAKNRLSLPHL